MTAWDLIDGGVSLLLHGCAWLIARAEVAAVLASAMLAEWMGRDL